MTLLDALFGDKGVVVKFKADLTNLQAGIAQTKADLTDWRDETNKHTTDMAKWGTAVAAEVAPILAVGYAMKSTIDSAEKYQDEIQQFAYVTGASTDTAQKWRAAAIATDTDFNALTLTMQNLNARVASNTADGEALRKTLTDMGVAVKDSNGNYVDADTLMKSILVSLNEMPSAQEKDAAAKEVLGRSWANLAEMINDSGTALKAYEKASPGISQADLEKVDTFKTKWAQLSEQLEVAKAVIGIELISAYDRAANGAALLSAATQMNIDKMKEAIKVSGDLAAAEKQAERQKWESENADLLKLSGSGMNWNMYNNQVARNKAANAKGDPFAGLSAQDAEIKNLKDFTIPALETKLKDLQTNGTASYAEIAAASLDLIKAKQELIDLTTKETDAQKSLKDATKDLNSEQQKLNDLDKDFTRELSTLNARDVSSVRSLMLRHQWATEDQQGVVSAAQGKVAAAAAVPGSTNINGNIYLNGDKSFEKWLAQTNRSMGVNR